MRVVCVIPARLESTRLPGKVLLAETGKPLICHTIDAIKAAGYLPMVVTDSQEIYSTLRNDRQAEIVFDPRPSNSGTDRIAKLFDDDSPARPHCDLIVAVQADEPEIKPGHIEALVEAYQTIPGCDMATLATQLHTADADNQSVVKVDIWNDGFAENFSRRMTYRHSHLGVYAYSPRFLKWFASQPRTESEERMSLEQLRALDNGCRIRVAIVDHPYHGIDTREQYDAFVARWKAKHNG